LLGLGMASSQSHCEAPPHTRPLSRLGARGAAIYLNLNSSQHSHPFGFPTSTDNPSGAFPFSKGDFTLRQQFMNRSGIAIHQRNNSA
jgi:hypothetical protein